MGSTARERGPAPDGAFHHSRHFIRFRAPAPTSPELGAVRTLWSRADGPDGDENARMSCESKRTAFDLPVRAGALAGAVRSRVGAALVAAVLLATGAGNGFAQVPTSLGPLRTSEQNPLYRFFYVPEVESADVVADGRFRVDLSVSYSNIFERSESDLHEQLFDLEQMANAVTVRYGVAPGFEVGGRAGLQTGWGGFLDGFVSGFHRMFGFPNGGREKEPTGQHRLYLDREDPTIRLDLAPRTFGLEDLRLFAKWRFLGSTTEPLALSVRGTLRRASGRLEPGRLEGALALLGRVTGEDVTLHFGAGATTLDSPAVIEPIASTAAAYLSVGVEGRIRPGFSMVGQMTGSSAYVSGFEDGELDRFPSTLVLGFTGRTEGDWEWQVSFAEDLPPDSPSVDFTVDLQLGRTF